MFALLRYAKAGVSEGANFGKIHNVILRSFYEMMLKVHHLVNNLLQEEMSSMEVEPPKAEEAPAAENKDKAKEEGMSEKMTTEDKKEEPAAGVEKPFSETQRLW